MRGLLKCIILVCRAATDRAGFCFLRWTLSVPTANAFALRDDIKSPELIRGKVFSIVAHQKQHLRRSHADRISHQGQPFAISGQLRLYKLYNSGF
jgi:hypothetical protein